MIGDSYSLKIKRLMRFSLNWHIKQALHQNSLKRQEIIKTRLSSILKKTKYRHPYLLHMMQNGDIFGRLLNLEHKNSEILKTNKLYKLIY